MSDNDIDKLLLGVDLDEEDKEKTSCNLCTSCQSDDLVINPTI